MRYLYYAILILTLFACKRVENAEIGSDLPFTKIYMIRHAEKDISNPNDQDPLLTAQGEQRANRWADILEEIQFEALYTTPYQRNIQTIAPLSQKTGLTPIHYQPEAFLDKKNRQKWRGKTVLVCGHSNTIPALANAILGEDQYPMLADSVYGKLFIITITGQQKEVQTLNLE